MPTFLMISRHSSENCPMINEEAKKMAIEVTEKIPKLAKKNRVKIVGNWVVAPEHLTYMVFEAASFENFMKFSMEPMILKWIANNITEIKLAMTAEESMKLLK
jgi:hypothetical protein